MDNHVGIFELVHVGFRAINLYSSLNISGYPIHNNPYRVNAVTFHIFEKVSESVCVVIV
ncbi:TPA: hypothetical protein ONC38_003892 [Enterobacter asburiae]|nr:hypothetical protein [Enterobacter asburiae]HCR2035182.1 hypothetical protein [Enterobacter asburiae]HCR5061698.1 hypothetical protein [Enterobacter asburiae]HDZ8564018.1 hypothetical protein [Enterobacter asburiae]